MSAVEQRVKFVEQDVRSVEQIERAWFAAWNAVRHRSAASALLLRLFSDARRSSFREIFYALRLFASAASRAQKNTMKIPTMQKKMKRRTLLEILSRDVFSFSMGLG